MEQQRIVDLVNDLRARPAETEWLEFKTNFWDPKKIGELVSALSNSARLCEQKAGFLVWGIDDKTHDVVGTNVEPQLKKVGNQEFEMWMMQKLNPSLSLRFYTVLHPDGRVVLLEVPAPTETPIAFDKIHYFRIGSATTKMSDHPSKYKELIEKIIPYSWENGIALRYLASEEVLHLLDYASYFELADRRNPEDPEQILTSLEAGKLIERDVGKRWNILNLGAILFAENLEKFDSNIQKKAVRVARYEGTSRVTNPAHRRDARKGYASDFRELLEYINSLYPQTEVIGQALRESRPMFPSTAIRELVANALIHQDMTITGAGPKIDLFSDRIEISNPGRPLVGPNRMLDRPPRTRNNAMVSLMRRMDMCEDDGLGMDKVFHECEQYKLPAPQLVASSDSMKVIVHGPRTFDQLNNQERVNTCYWHCVLRYEVKRGTMSVSSLCERFGIDKEIDMEQILAVIEDAVAQDLITRITENGDNSEYVPNWD